MIIKNRDEIKAKGFTVYSNEIHHNKVLSMKAKYLLMLILSLPESYSISVPILMNFTGEKRTSIKSAMEELVEEGFLVLGKQSRDENGQMARGYDCEVFETLPSTDEIAKNVDMTLFEPRAEKPHAVKPHAEKQQHINTINNKDYLNINTIISPSEFETPKKSKSKKEKPLPGNPEKNTPKGERLRRLFKEAGGQGEGAAEPCPSVSTTPPVPAMTTSSLNSERIIKAIMKDYSHLDFEVLEKSIQLAFEKEISDTKSFIAYVLTILSDWNAHDFTTIDKVEKHLKRILNTTPDLTLKPYRRVEMKPDWLTNLDNIVPYDPSRKFNEVEKIKIERMKELHQGIVDIASLEAIEEDLPF